MTGKIAQKVAPFIISLSKWQQNVNFCVNYTFKGFIDVVIKIH